MSENTKSLPASSLVPSSRPMVEILQQQQQQQQQKEEDEYLASSLEEAGALLGAAITRLSPAAKQTTKATASSSSTHGGTIPQEDSQPLFELFFRLQDLQRWLRFSSSLSTSTAAQSILSVLMTLFQSCVASTNSNCTPMLSHGIRHAWANSVAMCVKLSSSENASTTSNSRSNITATKAIIPHMMEFLTSINPKSQKAYGGTRLAAMCALQYIYSPSEDDDGSYYRREGSRWAMDALHQVSLKGMKSYYGNRDEPHHRIASLQCASNIVISQRMLRLSSLQQQQHDQQKKYSDFVVLGALEERTVELIIKLIRQASEDSYPEVRYQAGILASAASSVLVNGNPTSNSANSANEGNPMGSLEEVMVICLKNLDDGQPSVSIQWANALARCMCASMDCAQVLNLQSTSSSVPHMKQQQDDSGVGDTATSADATNTPSKLVSKWKSFRSHDPSTSAVAGITANTASLTSCCKKLLACIELLVSMFQKTGGEYVAAPLGGTYSVGGRATRVGYSSALVHLLRLSLASPHWNGALAPDVVSAILLMVGDDLNNNSNKNTPPVQQHRQQSPSTLSTDINVNTNTASSTTSIFRGSARHFSSADAPLARLSANRVLRRGLGEITSEILQKAILDHLSEICNLAPTIELQQEDEVATVAITSTNHFSTSAAVPNEHQLQVALAEMSHLVTSLGEAACESSSSSLLLSAIRKCRMHADPGVRCEAATLSAALVNSVPHNILCELLQDGIEECKTHHEQLLELLKRTSDASEAATATASTGARTTSSNKRSFRPKATSGGPAATVPLRKDSVNFLVHQYALHGSVLMLSSILHQLPHLPERVPNHFLTEILSIADILVSCQFNETLAKHNAGAACTCVRAGYSLFAAAVTIGPNTTVLFLQNLIDIWEKTGKNIVLSTRHFFPAHDLICLEAMIASLLSFLKFCSSLLISVPDALNRINLLLEKMLPLVDSPDGRLGAKPANPAATIRLNSVKAAIMETLTYLPPGSYPIAARQLFSMASRHIQESVQNESCCSILQDLLPNEDKILDLRSFNRAFCCSEVDDAREITESLVILHSEPSNASEAVMHSLPWKLTGPAKDNDSFILGSSILGYLESEDARFPAPSVLHEVSNWRRPAASSSSSSIRLVDAAIQAFASTFGLQSTREQEMAVGLLKSLLPTHLVDPSGTSSFSVKEVLMSENERRAKSKLEHVIASNIVATLILCIKSLPRHMGSDPDAETGPSWTKLAGEIFRILMGSCSALVRRSASEGLSLLPTCGYNENALALQTIVLTSLEETMQVATHIDGKPKKAALEAIVFSNAAALLTVGCLQRASIMTSSNFPKNSPPRSPRRATHVSLPLPSSHMIRRLLVSLSGFGGPSEIMRVYALHSLSLIIAHFYGEVDTDWLHVLQSASLVVEQTFISVWAITSMDGEKGHEVGRLTLEPSLQAALLRLMHSLLSHIGYLSEKHPAVVREALAFFDSLCKANKGIAVQLSSTKSSQSSYYISTCIALIEPERTKLLTKSKGQNESCSDSQWCHWSALKFLKRLIHQRMLSEKKTDVWFDSIHLRCKLFSFLEMLHGTNCFQYSTKYRGISAPRMAERWDIPFPFVLKELISVIKGVFDLDTCFNREPASLNWLLFSRILSSGVANKYKGTDLPERGSVTLAYVVTKANNDAASAVRTVTSYISPSRWQVKMESSYTAQLALISLSQGLQGKWGHSPHFNPIVARDRLVSECVDFNSSLVDGGKLYSYASLHIEEILSAACSLSTATSDQAELLSLQLEGLRWLSIIIQLFCDAINPESSGGAKEKELSQFSSQIVSSIRHGLSEPSSLDSMRLYLCGLEAAFLILDTSIVNDLAVIRRLFRLVLPTDLNISFKSYAAFTKETEEADICMDSGVTNCVDLMLFRRITKIGSFAQLKISLEIGSYSGLSQILAELTSKELIFAAHAAAMSIDAFRLFYGGKLAKSSSSRELDDFEMASQTEFDKGLYFSNIDELCDETLTAFSRFWPSLVAFAASRFAAHLNCTDSDEGTCGESVTNDACTVWLNKLLPLLFTGAKCALNDRLKYDDGIRSISLALSQQRAIAMCIYGVRKSLSFISSCEYHFQIIEDLDELVTDLTDLVLLPSVSGCQDYILAKELIAQSCGLVTDLCRANFIKSQSFERAMLAPLSFVQVQKAVMDDSSREVLSTCLCSIYSALTGNDCMELINNKYELCISLIYVCLNLLSSAGKGDHVTELKQSTRSVLSLCFRNPSISNECKRSICAVMSSNGNWEAWALACCNLEDGSGLICSLTDVKEALGNDGNVFMQIEVLSAIKSLLQESSSNSRLLNLVMNKLGPEILFVLKRTGMFSRRGDIDENLRRSVCSEATEVLLFAFHQLVLQQTGEAEKEGKEEGKDGPVEDSASRFLHVFFNVLVLLIRQNGLPNSATENERSDPAIGKLCAKIVVQIAKTSAASFKMSVISMSTEARGTLESSMRAELTGYPAVALKQAQPVAPKTGKINFKSFT